MKSLPEQCREMQSEREELHGLIAKSGEWAPGMGLKTDFMDGSRAAQMQQDLVDIFRLGRRVYERTRALDELVPLLIETLEYLKGEIERGKNKDCLGCLNGRDMPEENLCRACWRIWAHGKMYLLWDWQETEKKLECLARIRQAVEGSGK